MHKQTDTHTRTHIRPSKGISYVNEFDVLFTIFLLLLNSSKVYYCICRVCVPVRAGICRHMTTPALRMHILLLAMPKPFVYCKQTISKFCCRSSHFYDQRPFPIKQLNCDIFPWDDDNDDDVVWILEANCLLVSHTYSKQTTKQTCLFTLMGNAWIVFRQLWRRRRCRCFQQIQIKVHRLNTETARK